MLKNLFGKNKPQEKPFPIVLGLDIGTNFSVETLELSVNIDKLLINAIDKDHIVEAVGYIQLDGTHILRYYTDTEGWLEVIMEGSATEEAIVSVKLYYFYDTLDYSAQSDWDTLLRERIGQNNYTCGDFQYSRVWTAGGDYHQPVYMQEKTFRADDEPSSTDQFVMLFEREYFTDNFESLFLSAEEIERKDTLERSLVISSGYNLTPNQLRVLS